MDKKTGEANVTTQENRAEMYQRAIANAVMTPVIRRYSQNERTVLEMHGITEDSRRYESAADKLQAEIKNAIESAIGGFRA